MNEEDDILNDLLRNDEAEDQEVDIELSTANLIESIEEAWMNEKFSPEILPHKLEFVELYLGQLSAMEENLENLGDRDLIKKKIHQMEIDRLKFVVSSYLRIRLEKIELYVGHILNQENERLTKGEFTYLTDAELEYARNFKNFTESLCGKLMSGSRQTTTLWKNHIIQPNLQTFVFLKSKADIETIAIDEGNVDETVYVNKGSQIIISYKSVSNLIRDGDMKLI